MEYFVTANGITVHLLDTEENNSTERKEKTLVLLHGYMETMNIWNELIDALKDKYRIITMDMPGHGLTDSAPATDGQSVNTMEFCADVVKCIMDKCKVDKAVIGGHSMGGYVGEVLLDKYSERVEKLILFNSNPYADSPEKSEDRKREIDIIRSGKLESLANICIPKMFNPENLRQHDDKVMETIELCEMHNPEGIIASILGMQQRPDMQKVFEAPKAPILVFCGDNDRFMDIEEVKKMVEKFPEVRFSILEDTGHSSFIEAFQKVYEQLCEFVG